MSRWSLVTVLIIGIPSLSATGPPLEADPPIDESPIDESPEDLPETIVPAKASDTIVPTDAPATDAPNTTAPTSALPATRVPHVKKFEVAFSFKANLTTSEVSAAAPRLLKALEQLYPGSEFEFKGACKKEPDEDEICFDAEALEQQSRRDVALLQDDEEEGPSWRFLFDVPQDQVSEEDVNTTPRTAFESLAAEVSDTATFDEVGVVAVIPVTGVPATVAPETSAPPPVLSWLVSLRFRTDLALEDAYAAALRLLGKLEELLPRGEFDFESACRTEANSAEVCYDSSTLMNISETATRQALVKQAGTEWKFNMAVPQDQVSRQDLQTTENSADDLARAVSADAGFLGIDIVEINRDSDDDDDDDDLTGSAIAGIVVGCIVAVACIVSIAVYLVCGESQPHVTGPDYEGEPVGV